MTENNSLQCPRCNFPLNYDHFHTVPDDDNSLNYYTNHAPMSWGNLSPNVAGALVATQAQITNFSELFMTSHEPGN